MSQIQESNVIDKTASYVKDVLFKEGSGHDWWHVFRVWKLSNKIQSQYAMLDTTVIELTALLHDIADWKFNNGDFKIGSITAKKWLTQHNEVTPEQIDHVCYNIENLSFKGLKNKPRRLSLEGQIVQDADRLDAMGAIGIARTFTYGGYINRLIYEPVFFQQSSDAVYISEQTETSIDHFYQKLLRLKDLMNTPYAKNLAQKRHAFMKDYLSHFFEEWNGDE